MSRATARRVAPAMGPLSFLAALLATLLVTSSVAHAAWQSSATATLAVTTAAGTVSPPTGVTCTNGTGRVTISWTPGPTLVTGYAVVHDTTLLATAPSTATQAVITTEQAPSGNNRSVFVRATLAPGVQADSASVLIRKIGQGSVQCAG